MDGYDLSVISVFTYVLVTFNIFKYTEFEEAFVSGSALLGAMVGALLFGHYSDRIGRRYLYIFDLIFFAVFAILSALATNIVQMIVFRFFVGWGVGADYALSPVFASEMYPNGGRGRGYGWIWAFWSIGAGVAFLIGYLFYLHNPLTSWRYALGIGAVPAVIVIALRTRMPESSRWKIVEKGEGAVSEAMALSSQSGLSEEDIRALLREREQERSTSPGSISALFRGDYLKRTLVIWVQWILYDIAGYGFGLYSPLILSDLGIKHAASIWFSALLYVPGFLGALGAAYLNDSFGRRPLQMIGFGGMALAMLFVSISARFVYLLPVGIVGLIIWYGIGNLGPGNTMGLYAIEMLPTKLRSTSMGAATSITRFVSFLSAFEFPYITHSLGKLVFFEILLVLMVVALVFTVFFTPETRGLSLEQIATSRYVVGRGRPRLVGGKEGDGADDHSSTR